MSLQQTTSTILGGRCADSSALVRRRIKSLTTPDSAAARSAPRAASSGAAPGSRPARIGASYLRRNSGSGPSTPGLAKSTMAWNSSRRFCSGVPERRTRARQGSEPMAREVRVSAFLRRWACLEVKGRGGGGRGFEEKRKKERKR